MTDILIYRTANAAEIFEIHDVMHNGRAVERVATLMRDGNVYTMKMDPLLERGIDPAATKRKLWEIVTN